MDIKRPFDNERSLLFVYVIEVENKKKDVPKTELWYILLRISKR